MQYDRRVVESLKGPASERSVGLSPRALFWAFTLVFVLAALLR